MSELDQARYTEGRSFRLAGAPVAAEPWAKSADAEAAVEDLSRQYAEHEEMVRREKERLKRFTEKRTEVRGDSDTGWRAPGHLKRVLRRVAPGEAGFFKTAA